MGGNLFVGRILMGLGSQPAGKAPEVELEPIEPGAWAAWAAWAKAGTAPQEAVAAPAAKASNPTGVKGTLVAAR